MIIGDSGTTISNDGAIIIKLLNIEHPVAKSFQMLKNLKIMKLEMGLLVL